MKLHQRLEALEKQFITEPTFLLMADGHVETIAGPKDHLLTLFSVAVGGGSATPKQAAHLELIQCFYAGPVEHAHESEQTPQKT